VAGAAVAAAAASPAGAGTLPPQAPPPAPAPAPAVAGPVVLLVRAVRGQQYYGYAADEKLYLKIYLCAPPRIRAPAPPKGTDAPRCA
jgi:hypothetical protein